MVHPGHRHFGATTTRRHKGYIIRPLAALGAFTTAFRHTDLPVSAADHQSVPFVSRTPNAIFGAVEAAERLIAGEWFEIRERLRRPDEIYEYFTRSTTRPGETHRPLPARLLDSDAHELERTIEGGIFEYKRRTLHAVHTQLAEAEFSSDVFKHIGDLADRMGSWLLASAWERALLTQDVEFRRLSSARREDEDEIAVADSEEDGSAPPSGDAAGRNARAKDGDGAAEIRRIIADVHELVAADPSARMHSAIKGILVQLRKYREEAETYRKLREKASSYRVELYSRTFAATFQQIFETIRRNYETYMEEQRQVQRRERASFLEGLDTREWARVVTRQLEQASRIRAVLMYLSEQHSGLREPLVDLADDVARVDDEVDDEDDIASDVCGGEEAAVRLSRIIANECAARFRRWSSE